MGERHHWLIAMAAYEVLTPAHTTAAGCGLTLGHKGLQFARLGDKGFKGGGWGIINTGQRPAETLGSGVFYEKRTSRQKNKHELI